MTESTEPIPMRLHCPECYELHVDVDEFVTKPHHTHACQRCGNVWRPAIVPTVGVRFLPGFKNDEPPESPRDRPVAFDPDDRLTWPPPSERVQVWPWSDPTTRFEAFLRELDGEGRAVLRAGANARGLAAQVGWCWSEVGGAVHSLGDVAIWAPLGLKLGTRDVWEFDTNAYPGWRPKVQP